MNTTVFRSLSVLVCGVWIAGGMVRARAQDVRPVAPSEKPSERALIDNIRRFAAAVRSDDRTDGAGRARVVAHQGALLAIDELLTRFPDTSFRDDAVIQKLRSLAALARLSPDYLRELDAMTDELTHAKTSPRVAEHAAYFAIQAFVLGARAERMPEPRRLAGTFERYDAFLEDFPESEYVPTVRASLIRNAIALKRLDRADRELAKLRRRFPKHRATRRAQGEVFRARAIGRPFHIECTAAGGAALRTSAYAGNVVLIHFWASGHARAVRELKRLVALRQAHGAHGLKILGVNVDHDRAAFDAAVQQHHVAWPNCFAGKGRDDDLLIDNGVTRLPAYFLVDRNGILRSTDPGDQLEALVTQLLEEPPPKTHP
ncbi:MAG: redoxin family protein [Phycisphaerae bacterium]